MSKTTVVVAEDVKAIALDEMTAHIEAIHSLQNDAESTLVRTGVAIGYHLNEMRAKTVPVGDDKYTSYLSSIGETVETVAEREFGYKKSRTRDFMRLAALFGDKNGVLLPQYEGFSASQLGRLVALPDDKRAQLFLPENIENTKNMSVKSINDMIRETKGQSERSDKDLHKKVKDEIKAQTEAAETKPTAKESNEDLWNKLPDEPTPTVVVNMTADENPWTAPAKANCIALVESLAKEIASSNDVSYEEAWASLAESFQEYKGHILEFSKGVIRRK